MSEQQPFNTQRPSTSHPPGRKISRRPRSARPWPTHAVVNNGANFLGNQRPATAEVAGG